MKINDVYKEINFITQKLVGLGLSVKQNFPFWSGNSISCKEGVDLSLVLKNVSYQDKYAVLNAENNYNIKLIDGALVQFMYNFNNRGKNLIAHRLAFFPAPHLENYEDNPENHELKYFGDSEFHDIIDPNVVNTPIRIDFNSDVKRFQDTHHPYTHIHFGEYESCRIPVYSPVTPSIFINFILRNFYNTALREYCDDFSFPAKAKFDSTITANEKKVIHFSFD